MPDLSAVPFGSVQSTVDAWMTELAAEKDAQIGAQAAEIERLKALIPPAERVVWSLNLATTLAKNSRLSVVDTPDGKALRHLIPAGAYGPPTAQTLRLPEKLERATFRIKLALRTPPGTTWPWTPLGGKLPGLAGAIDGVSLGIASGGDYCGDKAWSGRAMFGNNARGESYMYGVLQPSRTKAPGAQYGEGLAWSSGAAVLKTDKVMTIEHEYVMNTPTKTGPDTDGRVTIRLDDTTVLDRPYTYRTRPDLTINAVMWSVFAGGVGASWAGAVDRYVDVYSAEVVTPT